MKRLRRGFTLLEVVLSMSISLVLLLAIYQTTQLFYLAQESGRTIADEATAAQGVSRRLRAELQATFTGWQPPPSAAAVGTAADSTTGSTTGSTTDSSTSTVVVDEYSPPAGGVVGDARSLTLVVEASGVERLGPPTATTSSAELRLIRWYLSETGRGLLREELPTVPNETNQAEVRDAAVRTVVMDEVTRFEARYFDGFDWLEEWAATKIAAPDAVEVTFGWPSPGGPSSDATTDVLYRVVVALPPAVAPPTGASTTGSTAPTAGG
ncbi:MAG: type II secretion system protein GspJ, partial [Planctomycetia bacterium]